jgi:hypothetical protein
MWVSIETLFLLLALENLPTDIEKGQECAHG